MMRIGSLVPHELCQCALAEILFAHSRIYSMQHHIVTLGAEQFTVGNEAPFQASIRINFFIVLHMVEQSLRVTLTKNMELFRQFSKLNFRVLTCTAWFVSNRKCTMPFLVAPHCMVQSVGKPLTE